MTRDDIVCIQLDQSAFEAYREKILAFNCAKDGEEDVEEYQNLNCNLQCATHEDTTTLIFLNRDNEDIIAYCAFRCAALLTNSRARPAIEIVNFAADKKYRGCYLETEEGQKSDSTYADYILQDCIARIKNIADNTVFANYIILFSLEPAFHFYERNQFIACPHGTYPNYIGTHKGLFYTLSAPA